MKTKHKKFVMYSQLLLKTYRATSDEKTRLKLKSFWQRGLVMFK